MEGVPRIEPRRWLFLLAVLLLPIGVGLAVPYRAMGGADAPASAYATGAAIGAAVGILSAVVAFVLFARNDTRRIVVARQYPHAVVVQARVDAELRAALGQDLPGTLVTVAFDTEGVVFFTGTAHPARVAYFPARDVLSIGAGSAIPAPNARTQATARLRVKTTRGDLQFAVDRLPHLGSTRYVLSEGEVLQLVERINRTGRTTATTPHTSYIDQRVPGQTAWQAQRALRIGLAVGMLLLVVVLGITGYLIATDRDEYGIGPFLAYVALYVVVFQLLQRALLRAKRRERAAGYTTLNHESFDLTQLHPQTGSLVRPAGGVPLSAEEFKRRLAMS